MKVKDMLRLLEAQNPEAEVKFITAFRRGSVRRSISTATRRRAMAKRFRISDEKIIAVARLMPGNPNEEEVSREFALLLDYDWPDAEGHQQWLDMAPPEEISAWLVDLIADGAVEDKE